MLSIVVCAFVFGLGATLGSHIQAGGLGAAPSGDSTGPAGPGPLLLEGLAAAGASEQRAAATFILHRGGAARSTSTPARATTTVASSAAAAAVSAADIWEHWGSGNEWMARVAAVQADCALETEDIRIHEGGGFASKFQLVAAKVMRALRSGKAVRLVGHMAGYTENEPCRAAVGKAVYSKRGSYSCFFRLERDCDAAAGGAKAPREASAAALRQIREAGEGATTELYQAVEAYLFRPNAATLEEFRRREERVKLAGSEGGLLLGIHARRGDKVVDAYNRYYTSREYALTLATWAEQAKPCVEADTLCTVYVASDSAAVLGEIRRALEPLAAARCRFRVIGMEKSVTQQTSDSHKFDSWSEIQGMAGKVGLMKGEEAKEAAVDILFDIYMLSRADMFVGTLTSQIGRIAAGLKLAAGLRRARRSPPLALDFGNLASVRGMGAGLGIPSPEGEAWAPPPAIRAALYGSAGFPSEAVRLVHLVQSDCAREAEEVEIPQSGDLAARILAAAARAAAVLRRGRTVQLRGHFGGYSDLDVCRSAVGEEVYKRRGTFTCFFLPERPCGLLQQSSVGPEAAAEVAAARVAAVALQELGEGELLHAVEAYLFRPSEETEAEFLKREWIAKFDGRPGPLLGVHVAGARAAGGARRPALDYAKAVRAWAAALPARPGEPGTGPCTVFVASDGDEALSALRAALDGKQEGRCSFFVTGLKEYWAHHHYAEGWPGKLKGADGRWASRDLLFDVHVLSRADALIATLASPTARLAAGLRSVLRGKEAAAAPPVALDLAPGLGLDEALQSHRLWAGWVPPPP